MGGEAASHPRSERPGIKTVEFSDSAATLLYLTRSQPTGELH
jgi:hypothetical protein